MHSQPPGSLDRLYIEALFTSRERAGDNQPFNKGHVLWNGNYAGGYSASLLSNYRRLHGAVLGRADNSPI
jgi:hypothetical protein